MKKKMYFLVMDSNVLFPHSENELSYFNNKITS